MDQEDEDIQAKIRAVQDDTASRTNNASLLARRAGVSLGTAKEFLKQSASRSVAAPRVLGKLNPKHWYAPGSGAIGEYAVDVLHMSNYALKNREKPNDPLDRAFQYIVTFVGFLNRRVYAEKLRSTKSDEMAHAMYRLIKKSKVDADHKGFRHREIKTIRMDGGPEFQGFTTLMLRDVKTPSTVTEAYTSERLIRLNRFHRTLREWLRDHFQRRDDSTVFGNEKYRWIDDIDTWIQNYNSRPHSAFKGINPNPYYPNEMSPDSVTDQDVEKVLEKDQQRSAELEARVRAYIKKHRIMLDGTQRVRVLMARTRQDKKEGALSKKSMRDTWSKVIFTIRQFIPPSTFEISHSDVRVGNYGDGFPKYWPIHSLQFLKGKVFNDIGEAGDTGQKTAKEYKNLSDGKQTTFSEHRVIKSPNNIGPEDTGWSPYVSDLKRAGVLVKGLTYVTREIPDKRVIVAPEMHEDQWEAYVDMLYREKKLVKGTRKTSTVVKYRSSEGEGYDYWLYQGSTKRGGHKFTLIEDAGDVPTSTEEVYLYDGEVFKQVPSVSTHYTRGSATMRGQGYHMPLSLFQSYGS